MKRHIFFILGLCFLCPVEAQDSRPLAKTQSSPTGLTALYVIENVFSPTAETENLVRITLGPEGKLTQEKLLTQNHRFFGFLFGDEHHRIIHNRYLVTLHCGVIDLATRKVINPEDSGEFLGEEDGKIYYRKEVIGGKTSLYSDMTFNLEKDYFTFDLKTHQVAKISPPWHSDMHGTLSPDRTMTVTSESGGVVRLHKIDGTIKDIARGYEAPTGGNTAITNDIWPLPFLWLDNTRILTQKSNGKLVILNIDGTAEDLVDVHDAAIGDGAPPRLSIDPLGRIIYTACDEVEYLIEIKEKRASRLRVSSLGNGFEVTTALDHDGLFSIFHDGKEIGKRYFLQYQAVTAPGLIAFPEVEPHENAGYPKGVTVWNAARNEWQTTPLTVDCLVGWAP